MEKKEHLGTRNTTALTHTNEMKNQEDVGFFHDRNPPKFGSPKHTTPGLGTRVSHTTRSATAVCVKLQENKAAKPTHLLH